MTSKIGILVVFAALAGCAAADERRPEQRIDDLERRVKQLEAQLNQQGGSLPVVAPSGFSGRFVDATARRTIDLKMDGTFSLQTGTTAFTGSWQKTGDQVVIRAPSGLTETFRVTGNALVDSQSQRWAMAKMP